MVFRRYIGFAQYSRKPPIQNQIAAFLSTNLETYSKRPKLRQRHRYFPRQTPQETGTPGVVAMSCNRRQDIGQPPLF